MPERHLTPSENKVLHAALRRSSTRIDGWQPIETAPKTGPAIDLWIECRFGQYREPDCLWLDGGWHKPADSESATVFEPIEDVDTIVTHWMPRPEPPARAKAEAA